MIGLKDSLIKQVKNELADKHKHINMRRKYSKERFSLLDALPRQHYEDLHSNILAYLLNPHASHDCDDFFLKRFITDIVNNSEQITNFNLRTNNLLSARVITEKYTGEKTNKNGGRIDIIITGLEKVIIIENKIYAKDQEHQLVRYNNDYPDAILLYLTPFGKDPSEDSITEKNEIYESEKNTNPEKANQKSLIKGADFDIISYSSHIIEWLKSCREQIWDKPNVTFKLSDYIKLLEDKILNSDSETNTEMKDTLLKPENIEFLKFINVKTIIDIRYQSRLDFLNSLFNRMNKNAKIADNIWKWVKGQKTENAPTPDDLHKNKYYGFQSKANIKIHNSEIKLNIEAQNNLGSLICGFFIFKSPNLKEIKNEFTNNIKSTDFSHLEIENNQYWVYVDLLKGYPGYKLGNFYSDSNNYLFLTEKDNLVEYALKNINHIYNSHI